MLAESLLRKAFEEVAQHLCNLDNMSEIVTEIENETDSLEASIKKLESLLVEAEVTLKTDIRILINECRHIMGRKMDR
jgi:hypothetical protein